MFGSNSSDGVFIAANAIMLFIDEKIEENKNEPNLIKVLSQIRERAREFRDMSEDDDISEIPSLKRAP